MEIQALRDQLKQCFQEEKWLSLGEILAKLVMITEQEGNPELCLRAQRLQLEITRQGEGGARSPSEALEGLFQELLSGLTHLQWRNQSAQPIEDVARVHKLF